MVNKAISLESGASTVAEKNSTTENDGSDQDFFVLGKKKRD